MCEVRNKVDVIEVNMTCPVCKEGYLIASDSLMSFYTTKHQHICNNCGYIIALEKTYPYLEYEMQVPINVERRN